MAERHHIRLEFWESLINELNKVSNTFKNVSPTTDNWITGSTGVSGISNLIIVRKGSCSIQLVFDKRDSKLNKSLFDSLFEFKEEIDNQFQSNLIWRRMDDQISSRIQIDIPEVSLDRSTWSSGLELLANQFVNWENVFKPFIKKIAST